MIERPRVIDVVRKPRKCPVCGERVVDIIYGTGDMTDVLLFEKEQKVFVHFFGAKKRNQRNIHPTKPPHMGGCNLKSQKPPISKVLASHW